MSGKVEDPFRTDGSDDLVKAIILFERNGVKLHVIGNVGEPPPGFGRADKQVDLVALRYQPTCEVGTNEAGCPGQYYALRHAMHPRLHSGMGRRVGENRRDNWLARSEPGAIGANGVLQGARKSIDATLSRARLLRDPPPVAANDAPPMAHTLYPAPRVGNGPTREFAPGTESRQAFVSAITDPPNAACESRTRGPAHSWQEYLPSAAEDRALAAVSTWGKRPHAALVLRTRREPRGTREARYLGTVRYLGMVRYLGAVPEVFRSRHDRRNRRGPTSACSGSSSNATSPECGSRGTKPLCRISDFKQQSV
jgi:hypothetical protein